MRICVIFCMKTFKGLMIDTLKNAHDFFLFHSITATNNNKLFQLIICNNEKVNELYKL